jgi:DNA-binding MarR family transcriptional regulator
MTDSCDGQDVAAFRSFMSAHALLVGAIERAFAEAELPPLSWHDVLATLERSPEGMMRIHALADEVVLSRSGATRLIDRIEADGLMRRERCGRDRRGAYAVITEDGRAVLERMRPVYRVAVEEHFLPHLGDEAGPVREALDRVIDSARRTGAPAAESEKAA